MACCHETRWCIFVNERENPCGFVRSVDEISSKSAISPQICFDSDSGESSMTYACKFQRQVSGQKKHNFLVVRLWKTEPHLHHCAVQRHLRQKLNITKNERIGYTPRLGRAIPSSTLADHWSAKAYRTGEANIELRHCFLNFLKHAPNNRHPYFETQFQFPVADRRNCAKLRYTWWIQNSSKNRNASVNWNRHVQKFDFEFHDLRMAAEAVVLSSRVIQVVAL
jgi:hypothetical protein